MPGISEYALLGDCHSAALVSGDGSVDWWSPARFDAPSVFTRLLDRTAGHWWIRPTGRYETSRQYIDGTMVVQTEFRSEGGVVRLTDGLALGSGERGHDIGYQSPHVLVRHVEALEGELEVAVELVAKPEYGLVSPQISQIPIGIDVIGGADRLLLVSDADLHVDGGLITGTFTLSAGQSVAFCLQHRRSVDPPRAPLDARALLEDTIAGWQSWSEMHHKYDGPYRDLVKRSVLTLQALTYQPTGAVVAAPTTSLPERFGGQANWDYRFGWLRDGGFTLKALYVAACAHEGQRFFDWITSSAGPSSDDHLQIMFGVGGEHDLTEHPLDHLAGYAHSRPVRVGNNAWKQKQLDVLGEVLECAWVLRDQLTDDETTRSFLRSVADRAARTWQQRDAGIWEGREGERDYVTSKLMCWVALDRAIRLADQLGPDADVQRWTSARDDVRQAILDRGWSAKVGAFTGAFDSDHLDAGVLLLPIMGFLPGDDQRVVSTVDAIERELGKGPLVQRWTGSGDEGAFVICSYWLATARALAGQVDRAKEIFEQVTAYANDLGLLSEEIHHDDGQLIGNFPQGLSHIGLIHAANAIATAQEEP